MRLARLSVLSVAVAGVAFWCGSPSWGEGVAPAHHTPAHEAPAHDAPAPHDAPASHDAPAKHDADAPHDTPAKHDPAAKHDGAVKDASLHKVAGGGSVVAYNYTAHGAIESLMIQTDAGMVQLNVPPESADVLKNFPTSELVIYEARLEGKPKGDHPVYQLLSVTNSKGEVLRDNKVDADKKSAHVEGTIQALNYSRGGDVNGVVLDTGDFIHLTPEGAKQINPKIGDKVSADGATTPTVTGHQAIEAKTVNGQAIEHAPKPMKRPPVPPLAGPHADAPHQDAPRPDKH